MRQKRISIIESFVFEAPKTKKAKELLTQLKVDSALFVTTDLEKNTVLISVIFDPVNISVFPVLLYNSLNVIL